MASVIPNQSSAQLDEMHKLYRDEGAKRAMAPQVVYRDSGCPHSGCGQNLHAIDFRLEHSGALLTILWCAAGGTTAASPAVAPVVAGGFTFTIRGNRH
jgi:hypothetical protein